MVVAAPVAAVAAVAVVDKEMTMTNTISMKRQQTFAPWALLRACVLAFLLSPLAALAAEQATFATPEAAVQALSQALKASGDEAMLALFGKSYEQMLIPADAAEKTATRAKIAKALDTFQTLEYTGKDRMTLVIGDEAWPMPIPLVREQGAWRFATEQGAEELINRRVGGNERNAISALRAYVDAQRQYASRDRNDDEVLEYAQRIASTPGKHDGLYWESAAGEEASPFGPLVANSEAYLKGHAVGDPFRGYFFRILKRQGKNAPGGAFSYVINGRMIAGFAMVAYPAEYGRSGIMTFIVSNNGKIYEKNRGAKAAALTEFNPDASWQLVESPY